MQVNFPADGTTRHEDPRLYITSFLRWVGDGHGNGRKRKFGTMDQMKRVRSRWNVGGLVHVVDFPDGALFFRGYQVVHQRKDWTRNIWVA